MKVINVTPGLLPIPPNGWGAVEKIIWDYHLELQNSGIASEILYLNDVKYDDSKVVHVHVANLANQCFERGIPYIFTIHDHHAYLYGKDSPVFKENLKAIENSVISTSPCEFLVDYFGSKKLRYFSHAVNTNIFKYKDRQFNNKLLCVANNGYASNQSHDRKGFTPAIEAAMELGMPITIAGPENNKKFFDTLAKELNEYSGLTKLFNLKEDELVELYNQHSIFLHMSELEAGHPNLTLLEAMACGLPIVGTFEKKYYDGMYVVKDRTKNSAINGIKQVKGSFDQYRLDALNNAYKNSYSNRVGDLTNLYSEYREKIFVNRLIDSYSNTKKIGGIRDNLIKYSYANGAKVEINGVFDKKYKIKFINNDDGSIIYDTIISTNMWSSPTRKYFTNWRIEVSEIRAGFETNLETEIFNPSDKKIKIKLDTQSLGDLIAYLGHCDEFQKKYNCILDCVIFNKEFIKLLGDNYKNINFIDYDADDNNYYASYTIGYYLKDWWGKTPVDQRTIKLNYVTSRILGLPDKEIKPKFTFDKSLKTPKDKKYVCIATQSTAQCKYWNNPNGWKTLIKYLNNKGYEVWCVDKHSIFGGKDSQNSIPEGAVDKTGPLPLEERMNQIYNAEFFIGLGSGLSWLAWALDKKVVLISGFSKAFAEFDTPYRIINESVCNGCWNNTSHEFDRGNWNWCPENKNFECTKSITPEMVISKINNLL